MKQLFLALSALLLIAATPNKVDSGQISQPTELAEVFLDAASAGRVSEAVDEAFTPEMQQLLGSGMPAVVAQVEAYVPGVLGAAHGYELYSEEYLSSRVRRLVYFLYLEKIPTVWEFYYYERGGQWELVSFSFNTEFEGLESLKLD